MNTFPLRIISENGLDADFYCAPSSIPKKAVIILGGSEGGKHWSNNPLYLQAILDLNYCVLVLGYFGTPTLPKTLRRIPLEYFEKAFNWLRTQKEVISDHYALFGHSRGAECALLLASHYPQVKVVAALCPPSVIYAAPPSGIVDAIAGQHSPWSCRELPLPFVPIPWSFPAVYGLITHRQTRMFELALRNEHAVKAATIPVENICGAVLLYSSIRDEQWPSWQMSNLIMARLDRMQFPYPHIHISHDQAHGICTLDQCWVHIVDFISKHLE